MIEHAPASTREADRADIARTVANLQNAWNKHDVHAFALAFTEDADFTNVAGVHAAGRSNIEAFHAPRFADVFKESRLILAIRSIRFLSADLGAVDIDSEMTGAKFPGGSPRPRRTTLINCVMARQSDGLWLIIVLHNTELTNMPLAPPSPSARR